MFRHLIDDYRAKAKQQLKDAADLACGAWRIRDQHGDQSSAIAAAKRSLARRLLGLADAYEKYED